MAVINISNTGPGPEVGFAEIAIDLSEACFRDTSDLGTTQLELRIVRAVSPPDSVGI